MNTLLPDPDPADLAALFPPPARASRGEQCRDARRALNVTQRELAVLAGVAFRDVAELENDREAHDQQARTWVVIELNALLIADVERLKTELAKARTS